MDTNSNQSGKKLLELSNEGSLITLNGRKLGDTSGKLTCHQYNGSSTIDLNIVSWNLYEKLKYFKVLDPVWFSDHCSVKMSLSIGLTVDEVPMETKEFIELEQLFQWSEEGSYKIFQSIRIRAYPKRLLNEVSNKCKEAMTQTLQSTILTISFMIFPKIVSSQNQNLFIKNMKRNAING